MGAEGRRRRSWREGDKLCQRDAASAVSAQLTPGEAELAAHGLQDPEVPRCLGGTAWPLDTHMPAGTGRRPESNRNVFAAKFLTELTP